MQSAEKHRSLAILLFALSPQAEAQAKRWNYWSDSLNLQLARKLFDRSMELAASTGYTVIHIDESLQEGASFGERFAAAFAKTYAAGFDHVVAIGSDCPGLNRADLLQAASSVQQQGYAFGPSPDGGAYIVALSKAYFDEQTFALLPWQQGSLWNALQAFARRQDVEMQRTDAHLPARIDADDAHSLRLGLSHARSGHPAFDVWIAALIDLLQRPAKRWQPVPDQDICSAFVVLASPLRGPPRSAICMGS